MNMFDYVIDFILHRQPEYPYSGIQTIMLCLFIIIISVMIIYTGAILVKLINKAANKVDSIERVRRLKKILIN